MSYKILLLTDSLSLPREKPEVCPYEQTWPELLKKAGHIVHAVAIGHATSKTLLRQIDYHFSFNPDIIIVQVGIVDCAPRFMTQFELELARKMSLPGKMLIQLLSRNSVRKFRKIAYMKVNTFEENIKKIELRFVNAKVCFIGILPASVAYEKVLPGVSDQIKKFNSVLYKRKFNIPLEDIQEDMIMSDGHHLNPMGHEFLYLKIQSFLNA